MMIRLVLPKRQLRNQTPRLDPPAHPGRYPDYRRVLVQCQDLYYRPGRKVGELDLLETRDGNMISQATFRARYNATQADFGKIHVVTVKLIALVYAREGK